MPDQPSTNGPAKHPPAEELAHRIAELERELSKVRTERDQYRTLCADLLDEINPPDPNWQPPPPEECVDAWDLLAELKQRYGGGQS